MKKSRILIVEDEAIIAMETARNLKKLGYEVISIIDTGEEAIKKAEEEKPDLVLMDIRISGNMDGIEAAKKIQDLFDIPIIFTTAWLNEETINQTKLTKSFVHIEKPIRKNNLKAALEEMLS